MVFYITKKQNGLLCNKKQIVYVKKNGMVYVTKKQNGLLCNTKTKWFPI